MTHSTLVINMIIIKYNYIVQEKIPQMCYSSLLHVVQHTPPNYRLHWFHQSINQSINQS